MVDMVTKTKKCPTYEGNLLWFIRGNLRCLTYQKKKKETYVVLKYMFAPTMAVTCVFNAEPFEAHGEKTTTYYDFIRAVGFCT